MNKLYIILITILIPLHTVAAKEKIVSITYDYSDFVMTYDDSGALVIDSYKHSVGFGDDVNEPRLPLIPVNVVVPNNTSYNSLSVLADSTLVMENVVVAPNSMMIPTGSYAEVKQSTEIIKYSNKKYPYSCAEYVGTSRMDGYTLLNFLVCPFKYDAQDKKLYFYERITLGINIEESLEKKSLLTTGGKNMRDIVKLLVVNDEDIDEIQPERSNVSYNDPVEYVIITSSSLAPFFQPIARWKKMKGIRSRIITIDEIDANYSGATMQLKIKESLYELYQNNGLKYVLLGGDNTVVPVQGCYGAVRSDTQDEYIRDYNIPTDLFYACFDGCFNWDYNGNGIYGQTSDRINMTPSIYVTRVPVRYASDVEAFSSKLLSYEKTPTINGWNNNILTAGKRLKANHNSTQSDAEYYGDYLYSHYIMPYWSGTRIKFYDTYTDFPGGANYTLNSSNLQTQLSNGYTFMDMITHGDVTSWDLEFGSSYDTSHAQTLNNSKATIISTQACFTNAFDSDIDPCLSEALIRNANNGVIAYWGSSREGWGSQTSTPSLQYDRLFYKTLFSTDTIEIKLGVVLATVKMLKLNLCNGIGAYRWLQFALNPIGDPEMPIYTTTPEEFTNCTITNSDGFVIVNTGVEGCSVCVMSSEDDGASYYHVLNNVEFAIFTGTPPHISVCITKPNYVPKVLDLSPLYIQNEIVTGPRVYESDIIKVGSSVTSSQPTGPVIFEGDTIQLKAKTIILEPETTVNINTNLIISNH